MEEILPSVRHCMVLETIWKLSAERLMSWLPEKDIQPACLSRQKPPDTEAVGDTIGTALEERERRIFHET